MTQVETLQNYYGKARGRLYDVDRALEALAGHLRSTDGFSKGDLASLGESGAEAREAVNQLLATLEILERTGLDVVDLQGRLKTETRRLVAPLARFDGIASKRAAGDKTLRKRLCDLEESAQFAAGALFPTSVRGLDQINDVILFKLRPVVLPRFKAEVERQQRRGTWTASRRTAVEAARTQFANAFRDLNDFLNRLAVTPMTPAAIRDGVMSQRAAMTGVAEQARLMRTMPVFSGFNGILRDVASGARDARAGLLKLEIPLFPAWEHLGPVRPLIDEDLYNNLAGVQKFALLNITARMTTVDLGGSHPLSPDFMPKIWAVFPDRIYLEAAPALIRAVMEHETLFEEAPAGLHRFNSGSFKQRKPSRGGLQLSYAPALAAHPRRVNIDADIDLFKRPLSHLFAEVLVNHLTGENTSQYQVHDILTAQKVPPIGDFEVLHTSSLA